MFILYEMYLYINKYVFIQNIAAVEFIIFHING